MSENGNCHSTRQDYCIGTAQTMSVDIDTTPDLVEMHVTRQKNHHVTE